MLFSHFWISSVRSEETNDLAKLSSEVTRNVPIEDPEPVQTVNNTSSQIAEISAKLKYRLGQFSASLIVVGRDVSLIAVHVFKVWFLWRQAMDFQFFLSNFSYPYYLCERTVYWHTCAPACAFK